MSSDAPSPQSFRSFELGGWEGAASAYADYWGALTSQAIEPLLDAAGVGPGSLSLDVASGPGWVATRALERGARVFAVDFSSAMASIATRSVAGLRYALGDAESLPFGDSSFDAVLMNFGLLHLGNPELAVAEAHRVLSPGGRFAGTVWSTPDRAVLFGIVLRAVQEAGDPNVPLPAGPPFFRFSDHDQARALLTDAGFTEPAVVEVAMRWRLPSAEAAFEAMYRGTARTGGLLRRQTPEALQAIRQRVLQALEPDSNGTSIDLPMPAVLLSAARPG